MFFVLYHNLVYFLLIPEIYTEFIIVFYLAIYYTFNFVDMFLRPSAKSEFPDIYDLVMGLVFLTGPFSFVLCYLENKYLIQVYFAYLNNPNISYLGLLLFVISCFIIAIGRIQLGRFASGNLIIQENHKLITIGIYGVIRNPIYFGSLLGVIGFALILRSYFVVSILFILYFLVFNYRIKREEKLLLDEFGKDFEEYMSKTKKIIPYLY